MTTRKLHYLLHSRSFSGVARYSPNWETCLVAARFHVKRQKSFISDD